MPIFEMPPQEMPFLNRSGEKIQEGLSVTAVRDVQFATILTLEFRCIPVSPKMVAEIELIEDPKTRDILRDFLRRNTQIVYSRHVISDETLLDMTERNTEEVVTKKIIHDSVGRLTEEFENIFIGKTRRFVEEGGL